MPKKVLKINQFHKGMNNNSDPSSLDVGELHQADNIEVRDIGKVTMPGSLLSEVDGSSGTDMPEGIGRCSLNGDVLHFSSDASFTCIKLSYGNGVSFNQGAVVGIGLVIIRHMQMPGLKAGSLLLHQQVYMVIFFSLQVQQNG